MHKITPAKLKPGITRETIEKGLPGEQQATEDGVQIRGKALVFWDPENPGKKLDAIDTDAITPAKDCVSESLDALSRSGRKGPSAT